MISIYQLQGLPDVLYAHKQYQFWYIFEGLGMENFGFYGNLVFLKPFGIFKAFWYF
jgi:hypothetical protein